MRILNLWVLGVIVAGCSNSTGPNLPASIAVAPPGSTIVTGDTVQLSAAVLTTQGDTVRNQSLSWSTSDSTLATVTGAGLLRGVRPGSVLISVASNGLTAQVPVAILPRVDSMVLTPDTVTNHVGDAASVSLSLFDSTGTQVSNRIVSWMSSDTTVVTLNVNEAGPAANGVFYSAAAPGTAMIIASCEGKSDTMRVTVIP